MVMAVNLEAMTGELNRHILRIQKLMQLNLVISKFIFTFMAKNMNYKVMMTMLN